MTIRIIVVDDHPVVRDGLRGMLHGQDDFEVVAEAANGHRALAALQRVDADVVLMDLRMPELDGIETTRRIHAQHPDVAVLVLTTFGDDLDIARAIDAGATGYLLKDVPRQDLFSAVRKAARGEAVLAPAVAARLMRQVNRPSSSPLTPRELDVLELVATGKTNKAIAETLHVSEATVKTHLINVFGKLGVDDRTAAVMTALDQGVLPRASKPG